MIEAHYEDDVLGEAVLAFDGRVLELLQWRTAEPQRLHVLMLHVRAEDPDRKGRRAVHLTTRPGGRGGGVRLSVREEDWARVQPVLEAAAQAARGTGAG